MSNGTSVDATVILNDEIKMLDQLIAMIEAFAKDYKPAPRRRLQFQNLAAGQRSLRGIATSISSMQVCQNPI